MKIGILYGISVGTGDPELITVKGLRLLQQSPVVAFPAGVNGKQGMAQQIIAPWLQGKQEQLALTFPYVQDMSVLTQAWIVAAQKVWQYLQTGKNVAFACEGDVSFYSTFTYLAQTLQQIHPEAKVELVPGICSPMAAAAVLGHPLTIRQEKLVVLPAIYTIAELATVLDWADVVVLMKVSSVYQQVWQLLQQRSLLPNSRIVVKATLPDMVIYSDLSERQNLELPYFSILIVHITPRNN
ncbi:MAG: precorrin-2 C(20)-methyltransferase [Calothrix sp. MO_167.B42]|nr:precorrin-2 C(20)-methyltransferase [Calothrix sp. MO_167.B42]